MQTSATVRFLCATLLLVAPYPTHAQESQAGLLAHASDDAARGRYSSAKVELQAAIAFDPTQAEPWYQLGLLDGQTANYRDAEQAFRHALRLDPHSAKAHCRLGQTLVAAPDVKEDWQGAVAEFRAALLIEPDYPEAESLLGLGLMHLGDTPAAITTLQHAVQLHPAQASAHLNLALVLEQQPDTQDEAVKEYRTALAAKPDAPDTESSLGRLLLRLGRTTEAEQALRQALQLNPDLQDAHYGLARVLKATQRPTEAEIEFNIAAALQQQKPESVQATHLSNEALQLATKGDLPGAVAELRRSILLKPDYGVGKYNLGLVLADSGDYAGAKQQLIDAVSLLPGEATVWFDLGRVFDRLGEPCNALATVFWATQLSPANRRFSAELSRLRNPDAAPQTPNTTRPVQESQAACAAPSGKPALGAMSDTFADHLAFARQLRSQDDLMGASGELLRVLALKPDAVNARTELAEIYASQSLWDRAIQQLRCVLLVTGDSNAAAHLVLGEVLLKAGRAANAAEQFDKVLALRPDSSEAKAALGQAQRALNRP